MSQIGDVYRKLLPAKFRDKFEVLIGCSDYYKDGFKETGCLFIHIPKAAGTSISHALYGENVGHYTAGFYKDLSAREYDKYFKFAIVRNPWDRVVSAYKFVKQGGTELVSPLPDDDFQSDEFKSFDVFVKNWLTRVDLKKKDVVFQPQYWYVCDDSGQIIVDYIGKLEKLNEVSEVVSKKLGRELIIPELNKSDRKTDYRSYFDEETKEIVAELYRKDIQLFGYDF